MNFLSTGVKEVTRRVLRQKNRLALANARKVVEKAETELGRRGWRELAGDAAVRPQYETLLRLDETLAAAQARIAELERGVQEQELHREGFRWEHQAVLDHLAAEREPVQAELNATQESIAEQGQALPGQNNKRHALQAEQRALLKEEKRVRWLTRSNSPAREEAQQKFDERRSQLTEQAALLAVERSGVVEPIAAGHERIKTIRSRLQELDRQVAAAAAELAGRERAAAVAVGARVKEIAVTRRQAQRIEEEKDEFYAVIGHRLAEVSDAAAVPEEAPEKEGFDLFITSRQQRQNYARLLDQDAALLQESRDADKQDLRVFTFVVFTLVVLVAAVGLLVFRTPGRHEWLPGDTQALVTVNVRDFTDADFTRVLQQKEPDAWQAVWSGLVRKVAEVPQIDVRRQVARISRALAPALEAGGPPVDCLLVDFRASVDVDDLVRHRIATADGFKVRSVGGLPMYEKPGVALAQIGPDTLALGSPESVEVLIRVRLGLPAMPKADALPGELRTDAQIFSEFAALDDDRAYRLVAHSPQELTSLTDPLLNTGLLKGCDALGLTLDMHEPMSAVFVLRTGTAAQAREIAHTLETTPDQVLQLQSAEPNLFIEKPSVATLHDTQVEWKFRMTEPAAKELLEKVSRVGIAEPKRVAKDVRKGCGLRLKREGIKGTETRGRRGRRVDGESGGGDDGA